MKIYKIELTLFVNLKFFSRGSKDTVSETLPDVMLYSLDSRD